MSNTRRRFEPALELAEDDAMAPRQNVVRTAMMRWGRQEGRTDLELNANWDKNVYAQHIRSSMLAVSPQR